MKTYVILLRGVMPTGKNKVPMAALREALTAAGLAEVKTYIQSGNVIASSRFGQAKIEALVHDVIKQEFGGDIAVVARRADEFSKIMQNPPFKTADTSRRYFTVLSQPPDPKLVDELSGTDWSPDKVRILGDVVYTLYATRYSDSKFNNNFFERKLKVAATTRNFNTMTRLVALSAEKDG